MKKINLPQLITSELFEINNFDVKIYSASWGDFLIIDDFWKYPDKIHKAALKIPTVKLKGSYNVNENGSEYYDGRSHFIFYERQLFMDVIDDVISKCFNVNLYTDPTQILFPLSNNIFNIKEKYFEKYCKSYYGPHEDGNNTIAAISYLNEEYDEDDGTVMFDGNGFHKTSQAWVEKSDVAEIGFLQAKYNRLIIYDGSIHHASSITKRWINDIRHTIVYFTHTI
jgi:hypothetical protein